VIYGDVCTGLVSDEDFCREYPVHPDSDSDRLSVRISSCHVDSASLAIYHLGRNSDCNTAKSDLVLRPINSTVEYDFTCQSVLFTRILI